MPALVEMTLFAGDRWLDDGYNTWLDDDYNTWLDSNVVVRASSQNYQGDQFWDQFIIDLTPPQFRLDHPSGGYCKLGFGDMTLTLDTFQASGIWPPPEACPVRISYADTTNTITELFVGTMHRQKLSRDGIVYQLYERTFDKMLLSEAEDYNGDTVPLPKAFGVVTHQSPVRIPDTEAGNQVYHHGYLSGTIGVDWHVYDDGVNVDTNVDNATASTFEYTVALVGEITVSGTGSQTTLIEIFDWAAGASNLNLSFDSTLATTFSASYWANSQDVLVSFLDQLAAYASHLFYIVNDTLYLVDMDSDNGTTSLTEFEFYPASISFASPVSLVKTEWTDRVAVEETIGKYIKDVPQEVTVSGAHPYGNEESADCFQSTISAVTASLTRIHGYMTSTRWETSIPLNATFPLPGMKITALDESMGQGVNIEIHVRDIEYDFENYEIKIAGEGTIS